MSPEKSARRVTRTGAYAVAAICAVAGVLVFSPRLHEAAALVPAWEVRTMDGWGNNAAHPSWGGAGTPLVRLTPVGYADGIAAPAGPLRPSARAISNRVAAQTGPVLNAMGASDFVWQWGQFLDHDIDLTPAADPAEPYPIAVPVGDPYFDPDATGTQLIPLSRSMHNGGATPEAPRQQMTMVSAFIDASNVYGSDPVRAATLRTFQGGRLATSGGGQFLPFNTTGLPNAGGPSPRLFLAGDVRANEQIALTAMHTLFVREHNRLCAELAGPDPALSDEALYQSARTIVGAQMQVIMVQEFLPLLLGPGALSPYAGYDPTVVPGIANAFSTGAYRLGHSMLSATLLRVNRAGNQKIATPLKDAYFNPRLIHKGGGIAPILRGLATQQAQEVDTLIVDGVRNFLFGEPGAGGFDLAALNIQRGSDHGLADYNTARIAYGLPAAASFAEVTTAPAIQAALADVYDSVHDMDLWVAGLAEDHRPGAMVGETFFTILTDQFVRLRDGDRFWYQNDPFFTANPALLTEVEATTLAHIIRRNTRVGAELQDDVFRVVD